MFELPTPIILIVIGVVAAALFLFFWRAVRDLSLPMKIAARVLLAVVLILPLALAALTWNSGQMYENVARAPSGGDFASAPSGGSEGSAPTPSEPRAKKTTAKPKRKFTRNYNRAAPRVEKSKEFERFDDVTALESMDTPTPTAGASPPIAPTPPPSLPRSAAPPPAAANGSSSDDKPSDWTLVPVFYGTDRAQKAPARPISYDWQRGRRLELGRALVTIPKSHVIPAVERPWALKIPYLDITIYEAEEDPSRHFTIHELKPLSQGEFLELVREKIANATRYKDHALIFIHGYKTKFNNAVYRTAQIAYDLKFDAAPFLYSWPSGGTLQGYTYDRESAAQAEPYLKNFLDLVVNETGAKTVSVIAHSMGNQPLLRVLQDLKRAKPDDVVISQLVLAAPDVDRDSFENIVKTIKGIAKGVTLYTAANDSALQVSRRINGGIARAGDVPEIGPIVVDGIDTIDATATSMDSIGINHSGYAENNALLTDIGTLIRTGKRPPDERIPTLERVTTDKGIYWRYPQSQP